MQKGNVEKVLTVLKKTHSRPAEPDLSAAWKRSVMSEVHAASAVSNIPFIEKLAPRVAVFATIMLVLLTVPAITTVENLITLIDPEFVQAASDVNQFWSLL